MDRASDGLAAHVVAGGCAALSVGIFGACAGPPPPAPSPVIVTTPTTVCVGDDYKTEIIVDGTQSTPTLTLVPAPFEAGLLTYAWTLTGSAYRITSGSLTTPKLTVEMAGTEPLQVALDLRAVGGGSLTTTATVAITLLNEAGVCPLTLPGCALAPLDASVCPDGSTCDAAASPCATTDAGDSGAGG